MTAKGQTNWPPEKLEEWAKPALTNPQLAEVLIEIARTATSNNEAKKQVLEWVGQSHKELAQACRWLRILRVEHPARFEKLISQTKQNPNQEVKEVEDKTGKVTIYCSACGEKTEVENPQIRVLSFGVTTVYDRCPNCRTSNSMFIPAKGKIPITQIQFDIPHGHVKLDLRTKLRHADPPIAPEAKMTFLYGLPLVRLCGDMLNALFREDLEFYPGDKKDVMKVVLDLCVQILEEKLGLRVKTCVNCKFYFGSRGPGDFVEGTPSCEYSEEDDDKYHYRPLTSEIMENKCEYWEPKEVLKKKPMVKQPEGHFVGPTLRP